jgi:hypothetical protein
MMKPEGLAWDQNGGLLVVETGASRLSRINLSTGEVTYIAEGLKLGQPRPVNTAWASKQLLVNQAIYVRDLRTITFTHFKK